MRRATIVGFAFSLSPVIYAMGCAEQQEGTPPPNVDPTAGNTSNAGSGGAGGNTSAGKGGSTSPSAGTGGTPGAGTSGGPSGGASDAAGAGGADVGAGGDDGICEEHAECDDDNECTDDACNLGACQHTNNTDDCEDDDDTCTDDVCAIGVCTHPATGLCVCEEDVECDDLNPCTDDDCTNAQACAYTDNTDPCDFDDNECTTDVCGGGECGATPLTGTACADDGTDCTDQICDAGVCEYTNNATCECIEPSDCDAEEVDPNNCTFNRCTPEGNCDFVVNDSCDAGTFFVVNTFDSVTNWTNNVTTPGLRPLVDTGFNNTNVENAAKLHLAAENASSLSMEVASMAGLDRLAITISSTSMNTVGMVEVGVLSGSTWIDLPLADYAPIPVEPTTAVIEIPLLDFDVPLSTITEVRLLFAPTGGLKIWYLYHFEVKDN